MVWVDPSGDIYNYHCYDQSAEGKKQYDMGGGSSYVVHFWKYNTGKMTIFCILLLLLPGSDIQNIHLKNTSAEIVVPFLNPDWAKAHG